MIFFSENYYDELAFLLHDAVQSDVFTDASHLFVHLSQSSVTIIYLYFVEMTKRIIVAAESHGPLCQKQLSDPTMLGRRSRPCR